MSKLDSSYNPALLLMILHALFVIDWNITGIWLVSQGQSALGPTATIMGALVFAAFIVLYLYFYKKGYKNLFILLVTIAALLGFSAIYGAFTKDPALWPSEFWRYTGVAVNSLGILGFLFTLKGYYKSNKYKIK